MKVEVLAADEADRPIFENLLQLYLHDFSEFDGGRVSGDGRFEYPYLSEYWDESDRHPFLIKADGDLGGFALIKRGSKIARSMQAMDVAEFFVMRGQRRQGVGREGFKQIARIFPGPWVVRVQNGISSALAFWDQVISETADGRIEKEEVSDGEQDWIVFRFEVSRPTSNEVSA